MYVVVTTSTPLMGSQMKRIFGPFETAHDAAAWAHRKFVADEWHVMPLSKPEDLK